MTSLPWLCNWLVSWRMLWIMCVDLWICGSVSDTRGWYINASEVPSQFTEYVICSQHKYQNVAGLPWTCVAVGMNRATSVTSCQRRFFKAFQNVQRCHLSLAYTLHEPSPSLNCSKDYALVILHGLFGSKQNHRSISKYGSAHPPESHPCAWQYRALAQDLQRPVYALVRPPLTHFRHPWLSAHRISVTMESLHMTACTTTLPWRMTWMNLYTITA